MEDFTTKYTNAMAGNTAIMLMYLPIGKVKGADNWINAQYFVDEMYYHSNAGRQVTVYINSPGGRIFDGLSIIQAILDCEADTHIVGMAASMAGIAALFGKERTMNDYSIGMIHPPQGEKDALLEMTRAQLKQCLVSRSKIKKAKIEEMLADNADMTWLDSSDMLEMGLVDKVINTGKKPTIPGLQTAELKNFDGGVLNIAEKHQFYTNLINESTPPAGDPPKKPETFMEKSALIALLGLPANATDAEITAKINELKSQDAKLAQLADLTNQVNTLTTEKTALANEKAANDANLKELKRKRATDLVENAVIAGKLDVSVKDDYINMAVENYDLVAKTIAGIKATAAHASAHNFIDMGKGAKVEEETYENLAKNNPARLQEIAEKEPVKFEQLIKAYNEKK